MNIEEIRKQVGKITKTGYIQVGKDYLFITCTRESFIEAAGRQYNYSDLIKLAKSITRKEFLRIR